MVTSSRLTLVASVTGATIFFQMIHDPEPIPFNQAVLCPRYRHSVLEATEFILRSRYISVQALYTVHRIHEGLSPKKVESSSRITRAKVSF